MNLIELTELVKNGESQILEFKKSTSNLKAAFQTICGFLNNSGGTVLIGVNDTGKIIGQNITDATKLEIAEEIKKIEPHTEIAVRYIEVSEGKYVISIPVNASLHAPHTYDCRAFQRTESQTSKMKQNYYEQMLKKRDYLNYSWEQQINDKYTISELDEDEIIGTIQDAVNNNRLPARAIRDDTLTILKNLELVENGSIKNAAVVLFAKKVNLGSSNLMLKLGRFQGYSVIDPLIDSQQYYCNVFQMLDHIDNFIKKHLNVTSYYDANTFKRTDRPTLPNLAIREAVINAVCHRDYSEFNGYVSIAIFNDRLEIWNNGSLQINLTFDDLLVTHSSILRNKLIAKIFYLRGYIESWGMGTLKILDLCKQYNLPNPIFCERNSGFLVQMPFSKELGASAKSSLEITSRQKEIVNLLKTDILSVSQIAYFLAISERTLQRELAELKRMGLIRQVGMGRATKWEACD